MSKKDEEITSSDGSDSFALASIVSAVRKRALTNYRNIMQNIPIEDIMDGAEPTESPSGTGEYRDATEENQTTLPQTGTEIADITTEQQGGSSAEEQQDQTFGGGTEYGQSSGGDADVPPKTGDSTATDDLTKRVNETLKHSVNTNEGLKFCHFLFMPIF